MKRNAGEMVLDSDVSDTAAVQPLNDTAILSFNLSPNLFVFDGRAFTSAVLDVISSTYVEYGPVIHFCCSSSARMPDLVSEIDSDHRAARAS